MSEPDTATHTAAPPGASLPLYVDLEGASELTSIPIATFRTWRARGQGPPACKVGTRVFIKTADLIVFMEARRECREEFQPETTKAEAVEAGGARERQVARTGQRKPGKAQRREPTGQDAPAAAGA